MFKYSINLDNYTWKNAFLWGNFLYHCKKAREGSLGNRIIHGLIAAIEIFPFLGQIAAIFEKLIVTKCSKRTPPPLAEKKIIIESNPQKERAATKIQKISRGFLTRKRVEKRWHFLNYIHFLKAKTYIQDRSKLANLTKAACGKSPVYFLSNPPLAIKQCKERKARFSKIKEAQELCEQSGYKDLEIPAARLFGKFIIERKLPLSHRTIDQTTREQMLLYSENRENFTPAIQEFVGFLCQSKISDITGNTSDRFRHLATNRMGRYDNIGLYLEKNQGKIGLIDLEDFSSEVDKSNKDWCFLRCQQAVSLFPYHLEEILKSAKEFDPNIEDYRQLLIEERDESLKRFEVFEKHLNFVKEKEIPFDKPLAFKKLSKEKEQSLKESLEKELRNLHENENRFQGCLGDNPNKTIASFNETAFPRLLEDVYKVFSDLLEGKMEESLLPNKTPSSILDLLELRSLEIQSHSLREFFSLSFMNMFSFREKFIASAFPLFLISFIFKELEKNKVIAYYNPAFIIDTHLILC